MLEAQEEEAPEEGVLETRVLTFLLVGSHLQKEAGQD